MPPFDREMVQPVQELLKAKGVELCLGDGLAGFAAAQEVKGGKRDSSRESQGSARGLWCLVCG
jgi:NADPH-dependent 2,4-dienoyl-CoA reductase/sulfur reductase-like enzyme